MTHTSPIECGDFNSLVDSRHGKMLVNRFDMYIGRSLIELGEFSEGEVDLFRQVIRPGNIVVEAGANIGSHTLPLARMVGEAGHVVAIEPQRIVFQTLCANMALNSLTNVTTIWSAVGQQTGHIFVPAIDYRRTNNFGGLGLEGRTQGERVPVITVDSLNLRQLHMLKADVEGMERAVLEGGQQTIARCKPLLYVENDRQEKSADLIALIRSMGYVIYQHSPPLYSPANFRNEQTNPFGNIVSLNLFAIHESFPANIEGLPKI